jgi:hypothetical protein
MALAGTFFPHKASERSELCFYTVTSIVDGAIYRYRVVALNPREALMIAKEMLPNSKIVTLAKEMEL